jgi:solute:Na+ symporter, SSS family
MQLNTVMAITLAIYMLVMYAIALRVKEQNKTAADFLVAGRRLPFSLAWMTLLATWYGGETLLSVSDEVAEAGISRGIKDPIGAGLCLLVAGWLIAAPLWRSGVLTVGDYFGIRYSPLAGRLCSILLVPTYFGWIAAQFLLLGPFVEQATGLPAGWGLPLMALLGTGYTLLGGMWSVALTDAVQLGCLLLGLVLMAFTLFWQGGAEALQQVPGTHWQLVPTHTLLAWLAVGELLAIGVLGNLPGQDLIQRTLSTRSSRDAVWSCYVGGVAYLGFGLLPVIIALCSGPMGIEGTDSVVSKMAQRLLSPPLQVIFFLAVVSCVLSTVVSAMLSPAGLIAQNLLPARWVNRHGAVRVNRFCVLGVALLSLLLAYKGRAVSELLSDAYSLPMASLCVPLVAGLRWQRPRVAAAFASMIVGSAVWFFFWFLNNREIPGPIIATAASLIALLVATWLQPRGTSQRE